MSVMLPVLADCTKVTSSITLKIKKFPEVKLLLELYLKHSNTGWRLEKVMVIQL
jgi:hypothetical protein